MSLELSINNDIKAAMKAKDKQALNALRAVKSAILLAKTEKGSSDVSEDTELKILQRLVKQRKESAELYQKQGRNDLAEDELFQLKIIQKYLPEQMDEKSVRKEIEAVIAESGASSMKDMGRVMGITTKKLAGKADNKLISTIVKELLS
jgi:uncharacterized protein YqeY